MENTPKTGYIRHSGKGKKLCFGGDYENGHRIKFEILGKSKTNEIKITFGFNVRKKES